MIIDFQHIDTKQWNELVASSSTASWFQTPQAYQFYCSVADEVTPFCYALANKQSELRGVVIGYIIPQDGIKWYERLYSCFTSRAIIMGGPLLCNNITDDELAELLNSVRDGLRQRAIYVETRNFNDYSPWREVFENCGFRYCPHYNYLQPTATIDNDMDRNRHRNITQSKRLGAEVSTVATESDINQFYSILRSLYSRQLHLPLFSQHFFEQLVKQSDTRTFIVHDATGRVIGGELCVVLNNRVLYDWYGCGMNDLVHIYPSALATYHAICWARDNGVKTFDFMGAGTPDQPYGVRDFKARFGGKLVEHGRFLHVNSDFRYSIGKLGIKMLQALSR